MDSRKLNGTMADFQWHIEAGVNYLNEFINPITLKMRSAIETDTDWDFRYYIEEVPVKIDSNTFFNLVVSSATAAVKGENATEIRRGDLDSNTVVFGIDVKYEDKDVPAFRIYVLKSNQDLDSEDSVEISTLYLHCAGGKQFVEKFVSIFTEELKNTHTAAKAALVRWIFSSRNGARNKTFQIRKTWDIDRCFYPWINSDLNAYYKAFLESRAQILILYGAPAT